jgi:hypothetical protein
MNEKYFERKIARECKVVLKKRGQIVVFVKACVLKNKKKRIIIVKKKIYTKSDDVVRMKEIFKSS